MSKIGKKPIIVPAEVTVTQTGGVLEFKKADKTVSLKVLPFVTAEIKNEAGADGKNVTTLTFSAESDVKQSVSNWGTIRALAANVIEGLTKGFSKVLEIEGVGYRANMEGDTLVLALGFSHPIKYTPRKGIKITSEKNVITVSGDDKFLVGQTAAEIRKYKKPEPYKGKGIKYRGEVVRRKAGKKVGATTGK